MLILTLFSSDFALQLLQFFGSLPIPQKNPKVERISAQSSWEASTLSGLLTEQDNLLLHSSPQRSPLQCEHEKKLALEVQN